MRIIEFNAKKLNRLLPVGALVAVLFAVIFALSRGVFCRDGQTAVQMAGSFASNVRETYTSTSRSSADEYASTLEGYFIKVAESVKPAVVNISTVHIEKIAVAPPEYYEFFFGSPFDDMFEEFFGESPRWRNKRKGSSGGGTRPYVQRRLEGTGSGVLISDDGYILTNEHVVRDADEIQVTLYQPPDGTQKKYKGKIVGKDSRTDLAVIKISGEKFPFARLGDSDSIKVGQWVIAIGSPFGLEQTVTTGIVSAKRQALSIEGRTYRDLIQTDAAINRGNSGGPLCNLSGEVIGINTAIYAPTGVFSGIGFAVPINRAKSVIDELIKKGKVTRGWLGVEIRPIDLAIEKNFGLKSRQGAFVANVLEASPAEKAGIRRGDVIIEFDGKSVKSPIDLQDMVGAASPEKKVSVKIIREGRTLTIPLVLSAMPEEVSLSPKGKKSSADESESEKSASATYQWEGMSVSDINDALRQEFGLSQDTKGVVVTEVEDYSRASSIGVAPGDVIKTINNKAVATVADFRKIVSGIDFSKGVVFDIIRDGRPVYLTYSESGEE